MDNASCHSVPGVGENDGPAIGARWNAIKRSACLEEWVKHLEHQDTAQSQAAGTAVYTTTVRIGSAAR